MTTTKSKSVNPPPPLMSREQRRRLLFAPIGMVQHWGGRSWSGATTIDEGDNTRKGSSNSEYAADFRRRSRLHTNDEGDE